MSERLTPGVSESGSDSTGEGSRWCFAKTDDWVARQ
jgi:hypothetical protein